MKHLINNQWKSIYDKNCLVTFVFKYLLVKTFLSGILGNVIIGA